MLVFKTKNGNLYQFQCRSCKKVRYTQIADIAKEHICKKCYVKVRMINERKSKQRLLTL